MRYSDLIYESQQLFKNRDGACDQDFKVDLEILLREAFQLTKTQFLVHQDDSFHEPRALKRFLEWRERLLKNEPIAYILGKKEFYSRDFYVDKGVLIPRPETEILVEAAVSHLKEKENHINPGKMRVLDIGTGSGVIAINLALETGATVTAVDISRDALAVLEKNIALHAVQDKVTPLCADLFPDQSNEQLMQADEPGEKIRFHIIVSNPPYVSGEDWERLPAHIKDYEPRLALAAEKKGTRVIERIAMGAKDFLEPGGELIMEIGYDQCERVQEILLVAGFTNVFFINDYSGIPRVVCAK